MPVHYPIPLIAAPTQNRKMMTRKTGQKVHRTLGQNRGSDWGNFSDRDKSRTSTRRRQSLTTGRLWGVRTTGGVKTKIRGGRSINELGYDFQGNPHDFSGEEGRISAFAPYEEKATPKLDLRQRMRRNGRTVKVPSRNKQAVGDDWGLSRKHGAGMGGADKRAERGGTW